MPMRIAQSAFNWMYENLPDELKGISLYCPKFFYMEDQEFIDKFMQETKARAKEIKTPIPTMGIKICPSPSCETILKERQNSNGFFEMYCPNCGGSKIYWKRQEDS